MTSKIVTQETDNISKASNNGTAGSTPSVNQAHKPIEVTPPQQSSTVSTQRIDGQNKKMQFEVPAKQQWKKHAALLVYGPGSLYQVYPTTADCSLLHPWTKQSIGHPTVYLVTDVYSAMVVGFHVSLEGPSLVAAALALVQAVRNKGEVLKELDLDLSPDLWPAEGAPHALVADRGEMISKTSDAIPRLLDCVVVNSPVFRPDARQIMEQALHQTELRCLKWTPGFKPSCDCDRQKWVSLDLRDFSRSLALALIARNSRLLRSYPLAKDNYLYGLPPCPLELWRWGMNNRTGVLRPIDTKTLYTKLLPRSTARLTRSGIMFRGITFTNSRLEKEGHFFKGSLSSQPSVVIAYDPSSLANTFVVSDKCGSNLERLELTPKWQEQHFGELSWREVETLCDHLKAINVPNNGDTTDS